MGDTFCCHGRPIARVCPECAKLSPPPNPPKLSALTNAGIVIACAVVGVPFALLGHWLKTIAPELYETMLIGMLLGAATGLIGVSLNAIWPTTKPGR